MKNVSNDTGIGEGGVAISAMFAIVTVAVVGVVCISVKKMILKDNS